MKVCVVFVRPFSWLLLGKHYFLTRSLSFPSVLLGFSSGKHYFPMSLGFQKENIRYLGYFSGKSDFPDIFAFFRFSQGKHTLPWLFLGKIQFS